MNILGLTLQNFKSFRGEHKLVFDTRPPGLYYVGGRNEVEPRLQSNGAGKSTIWEALFWVFYGRTPRNVRSGDLKPWGTQGESSVEVIFEIDGECWSLARQVGKSTCILTSEEDFERGAWEEVNQERIQRLIRLNQTEFLHTIFMGQGVPLFFDLTPSQKMEIIQEILELSAWEQRSKQAATEAATIERKIQAEENSRDVAIAKAEAHKRTFERETERSRTWEEEQKQKILSLKQVCMELQDKLVALKSKSDAEAQDDKELVLAEELYSDCLVEQNESNDAVVELRRDLRQLERDQKQLEAEIQEFSVLPDGKKCPTCWQKVTATHQKRCVAALTLEIRELQSKVSALRVREDKAVLALNSCAARTLEQQALVRSLKAEQERSRALREQRIVAVTETTTELRGVEKRLESLGKETNPYIHQASESRKEMVEAEHQRRAAEKALEESQTQLRATSYWIKGFKQIRLGLIDEALHLLEIEVNMALLALGLVGWKVSFAVERETKSGGVSKGFTVLIQPPHTETPIPWEAWSGGEGQRLRLAGRIGLASLILGRKGIQPSLEVWDEPTAFLGQSGIDDLVEYLSARAEMSGRRIFLVDHRTFDLGGFAGHLTVVKDATGSHVS